MAVFQQSETVNFDTNGVVTPKTVFIEIELICSDKREHQSSVEGRVSDIDGHRLPTWKDVLNRDYEPWDLISMVVDTSRHTVDESIQKIIECIKLRA